MSEVVATIILLALTVVLFSSIFAWVTNFPAPIQQNVTQFSANLVLTSNQSYVKALQITHLAGPSVTTSNTLVYLKSAYHPSAPEFQTPIAVAAYLPNAVTWNLGQTFNYTFPCPVGSCQQPSLPDNITVLVTSNDQLIFSTILPGTLIAVPPNFVETTVSPANPSVGASFSISTTVSGNTGGNPVYVTLANIPGLSGSYPVAQKMTYSVSTNLWTFTVPASKTTSNGTYYAFVNVTNNVGQSATAGVAVTLSSSAGGGGSSSLSVAVLMSPQPPASPGVSETFAAIVTYLGTSSNVGLTVTFWANQTVADPSFPWPPEPSQKLLGPSGLTISGPSTVTVYATTPSSFSGWLYNASIVVTAVAVVASVGSASGSTSFSVSNLVTGLITTVPTVVTLSHFCSTSGFSNLCPFLNATVWNNSTGTVSVSGKVYVNTSTGTNKQTYTISSTNVNSGSSATISAPGTKTRWKPGGAYTSTVITMELTVTSGGVVVGYLYDTYALTVT